MKTLKQLAQDALLVQDACNMSGIALSFGKAMLDLRAALPDKGTDFYNQHPITVLWASKISSLANAEFDGIFAQAYAAVCDLVQDTKDPPAKEAS